MNKKPDKTPDTKVINKEILELSIEAKKISNHIGMLKRKKNRLEDGPEKDKIQNEIKALQYQALFYLEKMENLNSQLKTDFIDR